MLLFTGSFLLNHPLQRRWIFKINQNTSYNDMTDKHPMYTSSWNKGFAFVNFLFLVAAMIEYVPANRYCYAFNSPDLQIGAIGGTS